MACFAVAVVLLCLALLAVAGCVSVPPTRSLARCLALRLLPLAVAASNATASGGGGGIAMRPPVKKKLSAAQASELCLLLG